MTYYDDFYEQPENKKYKNAFYSNETIKSVFEFISTPESIAKMIIATERNRPALEGIIKEVESKYPNSLEFDLETNNSLRQLLGSFCKYILSDFGFVVDIQKTLSKDVSNYIKSATKYKFDVSKAFKKIVTKYEVIDFKS